MNWNDKDPLEPIAGESTEAARALLDYAQLGEGRSMTLLIARYQKTTADDVFQPPTRTLATLRNWSSKFQWAERVAAYDRAQRDTARRANEQKWLERQEAERETSYTLAKKLQQRAQEMLDFPLAEITREQRKVSDDGKIVVETTIIKPVRWTLRDAAQIADIAAKLARLSAELPTDHVKIDEYSPQDLRNMSIDQLRALREQLQRQK